MFDYWFEKKQTLQTGRFLEELSTALAAREMTLDVVATGQELDEASLKKSYVSQVEKIIRHSAAVV